LALFWFRQRGAVQEEFLSFHFNSTRAHMEAVDYLLLQHIRNHHRRGYRISPGHDDV
jgi:hypothetical protein